MDKETAKIAKKFASRIRKAYDAEKVILFGSRARGDYFKRSDYDFIIVSKKFSRIPFLRRFPRIYDYWDESVDLEVICYTPEEFAKKSKQHGIVRKAVEEGVIL